MTDMPGFNAEASLYKNNRRYVGHGAVAVSNAAVLPQMARRKPLSVASARNLLREQVCYIMITDGVAEACCYDTETGETDCTGIV